MLVGVWGKRLARFYLWVPGWPPSPCLASCITRPVIGQWLKLTIKLKNIKCSCYKHDRFLVTPCPCVILCGFRVKENEQSSQSSIVKHVFPVLWCTSGCIGVLGASWWLLSSPLFLPSPLQQPPPVGHQWDSTNCKSSLSLFDMADSSSSPPNSSLSTLYHNLMLNHIPHPPWPPSHTH